MSSFVYANYDSAGRQGVYPARTVNVGDFFNTADLNIAFPPAMWPNRYANVSGVKYFCDGVTWKVDGGGGPLNFNLLPYARKMKLGGTGAGTTFLTFSTGATGFTFQLQTVVETDYIGLRLGVFNSDAAAISGMTWMAYNPAQLQADSNVASNYNAANWTEGTWAGGATTGTLAANSSGSIDTPTITWTDLMPLVSSTRADAGATLPIAQVRLSYPISVNGTYCTGPGATGAGWESDNAATLNRPWRVRQQPVIAGTNATKAALTSAVMSTAYFPPFILEYHTANGAIYQLISAGDSLTEGYGTTPRDVGWVAIYQNAVSTKAKPVEVANIALGGSTSAQIASSAERFFPLFPRATAIFPNGTPNDTGSTITAANVTGWKLMKARLRAAAEAANMKYFMWTMLPINSKAWGATDSLRTDMNTADLASTGFNVIDIASTVSGAAVGGQIPLTDTPDGTHLNPTGYGKGAVPVITKITL